MKNFSSNVQIDAIKDRMAKHSTVLPAEIIEKRILLIRGQKVMLDTDLAELYGVDTKVLKRAVRRNLERFPDDFMFELTLEEYTALRYHFGTLKRGEHSKYLSMLLPSKVLQCFPVCCEADAPFE